jgi:hypothetical protein
LKYLFPQWVTEKSSGGKYNILLRGEAKPTVMPFIVVVEVALGGSRRLLEASETFKGL